MSEMAHFFVVISGSKIHERVAHFFIDIYTKKYRHTETIQCDGIVILCESMIRMFP